MSTLARSLIAEFIGTFTLVFVGMAVVTVAPAQGTGVVVAALGHGLILVGLIYAYGHISGGHFNPAVTVGLLVNGIKTGKADYVQAIAYIVVQFLGGIVAAFLLVALVPEFSRNALMEPFAPAIWNFGQTTGLMTVDAVWQAAVIEAILTFFLVSTIYQAAVFGRAGNLAAVAIGLTLAGSILAGGVYTGASLNPARTLGPALAAGDLSYVVPYFVGIFGGGILAGLVHAFLLESRPATS